MITLAPGETVQAEQGALMFMAEGIQMGTSTRGGLLSGLKRKLAGASFFVTRFENEGEVRRKVGFSPEQPANVKAVDLSQGTVLCQRDAFLC